MMKPFNALERSLDLRKNYLLEASAGTGKTFSIQHLVVRLLVEQRVEAEDIPIDQILVVSFTRAATRDLKIRIRRNIEEALKCLDYEKNAGNIPDYLRACLEKGEQTVHVAKKRLQRALFLFDQAQIFTIHSFCARMLRQFSIESDTCLHAAVGDKPLPQSELIALIRDYFRTEIRQTNFSPAQIEKYLKNDPEQKNLLKLIQSGQELVLSPSFEHLLAQFNEIMRDLKNSNSLQGGKIIEDFQAQASAYKNFGKEAKNVTLEKVKRFAALFDQDEWRCEDLDGLITDGWVWTKALDPNLLKVKSPPDPSTLNYPGLTQQLAATLAPLIEQASAFPFLLSRLASECRQHFRRYQLEEEKFAPDDVLRKMHEALERPSFCNKVRAQYQAVIVDEFQDTDPLQWQIFSRLFLPTGCFWKGNIYLVGDPKQSIYSFRQADIYTYLEAAKAIGEQNCLSLSVNYRSDAPMVQALNLLFSQKYLPSFITLPRRACDIPCHPVRAAKAGNLFDEKRGAVHFMISDCQAFEKPSLEAMESHVFFPFIASEIYRLKNEKGLSFRQFAVLIRDRFQASRLAGYFAQMGIPYLNQRGSSIARSPALQAMTDLMQALFHPRDRGKAFAAFGSPLLGWSEDELKKPDMLEFIFLLIQQLRASLKEKGFAFFVQDLLQSFCKPDGPTVAEQLLARKNGVEFYRDVRQLADCIADHQYIEWNSPEGILPFLDQFQLWDENDDARARRFEDPAKEGVKILTLHMSKGLEFDVVFALGLVNRDAIKEDLIPIESEGKIVLSPIDEESAAYEHYCEERDSEKMRQFYVAMTRAKHLLYVPAALHFPSHQLKYGEASPLELFLARLHQPSASYQTLYERIRNNAGTILIDFIEEVGKHNFITYSAHQAVTCKFGDRQHVSYAPVLNVPPHVHVKAKPIWMTSFTSLSHQAERQSGEQRAFPMNSPFDYGCALKEVHTLPAGSETGVLIHRILEKISFHEFEPLTEPEQAISLVRPFVQYTAFKEWEKTIALLIFNALKAFLPSLHPSSSLSMLKPGSHYREMPFLFPYKKGEGIEDIHFKDGLIKGVIDMLFYHDGRYYLADWKTNWLGPQSQCYEAAYLHAAMLDNAYYLQASIYAEAIKRYLKLVDARPFEECFGGVYYLFLRGMQAGQSTGVYYFSIEH